jgi:hypothetical protein
VIHTYEGTKAIQILIVGRDITGIVAWVWTQAVGDAPLSVVERGGEVG